MEKKGLGKGLSALIPSNAAPEEGSLAEIAIKSISVNPFQPRNSFSEESLKELSDSIREHGIIQPLVVRETEGGVYQLVAGERRLRAARMAGLTNVPVVIKGLADQQSLEIALIENLQREDINPVDAARAYRRLMEEFGLTQDQVSVRVGKSRSSVANTLRLLHLPNSVLSRIESGELSEGHARALLRVTNPATQALIADDIIRRKVSVREAERMARSWKDGGLPSKSAGDLVHLKGKDPNLLAIEEQLMRFFGTRVTVNYSAEKGKIEIEFYGEEDLNRILALIGDVPTQISSSGRHYPV